MIVTTLVTGGCASDKSDTSAVYLIKNYKTSRSASVDPLPPGETLTIFDTSEAGIIQHLWFTTMSDQKNIYSDLVLRAYWDGEDFPSIEVPLADFFGSSFGREVVVKSAAVEMIPAGLPGHAALNCWIPMPFETARIEVENQGQKEATLFHLVNWEKRDRLPEEAGRLHAHWRRSNPVIKGEHHRAVEILGKGRYLGTILTTHRLSGGAWVEGGEDFHIDVEEDEWEALIEWDRKLANPENRTPEEKRGVSNQPLGPVWPTLPGIGGEDYFGTSWGYREGDKSLYHGVSVNEENLTTAYRFHFVDPIHFEENLILVFRNHGWDVQARAGDVTTVTFWYQHEPSYPVPALPPLEERRLQQE